MCGEVLLRGVQVESGSFGGGRCDPPSSTRRFCEWISEPKRSNAIVDVHFFCMMACLLMIGDWMSQRLRTKESQLFTTVGKSANGRHKRPLSSMMDDMAMGVAKIFRKHGPDGLAELWLLQTADLLAYEGYKAIDRRALGTLELRQSLESIIGHGVPIRVQSYQTDAFQKLAGMQRIMNEAQGNPSVNLKQVMNLVKAGWKRDKLNS